MTSKERVLRAIEFRGPDRVPFLSPIPALSDFFFLPLYPASYWQPQPENGPHINRWLYLLGNWRWKEATLSRWRTWDMPREDEFGCVWLAPMPENVGEVKIHPLKNIEDIDSLKIPDPHRSERFASFERFAKMWGKDKFILGELTNGPWERAHFLRGYAEIMEDLALRPDAVCRLLDRIVDEWHIGLIEEYARRGSDGVITPDDWGMQDRMMISPAMWRRIFKPRYARLIDAAHSRGMKFFLHSCGNVRAIIDDLVEIGLDALQKEDIESLYTRSLSESFSEQLCFLCPLDVQRTLPNVSNWGIPREVKKLIRRLSTPRGGFIGMITMSPEAINVPWSKIAQMHYYFQRYATLPMSG
jgi:uroporphyrinogen decarboxylase